MLYHSFVESNLRAELIMAKILIVDDSETLRSQLRKALEEAGHEVVEGYDGVNGLETLNSNPDVELILYDKTCRNGWFNDVRKGR